MNHEAAERTKHLKQTRNMLVTVSGKLRTINPQKQYNQIKAHELSARNSPSRSQDRCNASARLSLRPRRNPVPTTSTKTPSAIAKNEREAELFNKIMDKEANFSKKNIKIYQRKFNKYQKEGGELLCEFERLKF